LGPPRKFPCDLLLAGKTGFLFIGFGHDEISFIGSTNDRLQSSEQKLLARHLD